MSEDTHFFIRSILCCPSFYCNNNAVYYYRSRLGQVVQTLDMNKRILDYIYICKDLTKYINNDTNFLNSLLTYFFNNIYEDCKGDFRYKNNFLNLKSYLNKFDYNISENIKNVYLKKICLSVYFDDEEEEFKKYKLYNFILNSIRKYMPPFVLTYLRKHDIIPRIY